MSKRYQGDAEWLRAERQRSGGKPEASSSFNIVSTIQDIFLSFLSFLYVLYSITGYFFAKKSLNLVCPRGIIRNVGGENVI
jgi:hypothetical protein